MRRYFEVDGVEILKCRGDEKKLNSFYFRGFDENCGEEFNFHVKAKNENQAVARVAKEAEKRIGRKIFFQDFDVFKEKGKIPSR